MGSLGTVVCLFSTKGGVGRTTLASNLAVAFGLAGYRAVVADFDLKSGAAEQILGLVPDKTIGDLIEGQEWSNATDYLTRFSDKIAILPSASRPQRDLKLDGFSATSILNALRQSFEFVVVDLPAAFDNHVSATLGSADFIGLLAANDVLSLKNVVFALQNLALLGHELQTVRLILNQFDRRGLTVAEVEQAVGLPVFWRIDRDKAVLRALNETNPFVISKPRSRASASIKRLAGVVATQSGKARGRK